jgi:hypothetical protein
VEHFANHLRGGLLLRRRSEMDLAF